MGYYLEEDLQKMRERYFELEEQHKDQLVGVTNLKFQTPKGDEFAKHGFLRRCKMMWRCIENTFDAIPPEPNMRPGDDEIQDATIFLQCFIFHVFGACDDLAWILVHEKEITKPCGAELPASWIGLRKSNKAVREKLIAEMIGVLDGLEVWFDHVEEFRHSLAHRIPLYIPPYFVPRDREDDYHRLGDASFAALLGGNIDEHVRLQKEQEALTFFRPWFSHSHSEGSPHMVMHPQLLADFGAVLELGKATIDELGAIE